MRPPTLDNAISVESAIGERSEAGDLPAGHMAVARLYGLEDLVARRLREKRIDIARSMLEHALRPHELTVGSELLAFSFVDRCIDAATRNDWPGLLGWIDRTCVKYAAIPSVMRLFTVGSSMMAGHIDDATFNVAAVRADFASIADHIAAIVERPRASRAISGSQTLTEIDATLNGLMSRLAMFDIATAEHCRAVSVWCARIGKKMALSATETTFLMRAGLIHDIGKVTTPTEILNAPHRLSDPDMAIMRRHAEAGAAIVSEIRQLEHLTPAVRGHHERIDGRGYPDGRIGSEIPLTVRIVSVADSFNAMIGNRPYRLPIAPTFAIEQLKIHSGTQFDQNVVNAMIDVLHL